MNFSDAFKLKDLKGLKLGGDAVLISAQGFANTPAANGNRYGNKFFVKETLLAGVVFKRLEESGFKHLGVQNVLRVGPEKAVSPREAYNFMLEDLRKFGRELEKHQYARVSIVDTGIRIVFGDSYYLSISKA